MRKYASGGITNGTTTATAETRCCHATATAHTLTSTANNIDAEQEFKYTMTMSEKRTTEQTYQITLTKRQVQLLSYVCDRFSRLICGQDWSFQELMEAAWERRCKEATGKMMDKEWEGGWGDMRAEADDLCKYIKKRFWGLESHSLYGIHYDQTADILWDVNQVLRHQLWLDKPDEDKSTVTVDASEAMRVGDEPLITIKKMNDNEQR